MASSTFSLGFLALALISSPAFANHHPHGGHQGQENHETTGPGYPIPGASFKVYADSESEEAVSTIIDAFAVLMQNRPDYPRFDEALKKNALEKVIIESKVSNRDGSEFAFLVARTSTPGRVNLLISASSLKQNGTLGHPEVLAPTLAKEFQWVVSKADTAQKTKTFSSERDLAHAPISTDLEIAKMSNDDRAALLQKLFATYLKTVDEQGSLKGQPYYEVESTQSTPPSNPDSTTKYYDIRIREALQKIVQDPEFAKKTPKAVRSLLNGKIWTVAFVKIDQRDWATRTRVLPEDKAIKVGANEVLIQPASILVNTYRTAASDDPFYKDTHELPMGALTTEQLSRVIALEIETNITEKSMTGHTAQDAKSAPQAK